MIEVKTISIRQRSQGKVRGRGGGGGGGGEGGLNKRAIFVLNTTLWHTAPRGCIAGLRMQENTT